MPSKYTKQAFPRKPSRRKPPRCIVELNLYERERWQSLTPLPHLEHTQVFLDVLCGGDSTYVKFIWVALPEGRSAGRAPRQFYGTLATCYHDLSQANIHGYGIFVTVCPMRDKLRRIDECLGARVFFADDDSGQHLDLSARPPDMIVLSYRGMHPYWRAAQCTTVAEFTKTQLTLAHSLGTDPAVCDAARVMRLPGFWHNKTQTPFLVSVVHASPQRRDGFTGAELRDAFPLPEGMPLRSFSASSVSSRGDLVALAPSEFDSWPGDLKQAMVHFVKREEAAKTGLRELGQSLPSSQRMKIENGSLLVRCPAHDDHHPSLVVSLTKDGRVLYFCRSHRCAFVDIQRAIQSFQREIMSIYFADEVAE